MSGSMLNRVNGLSDVLHRRGGRLGCDTGGYGAKREGSYPQDIHTGYPQAKVINLEGKVKGILGTEWGGGAGAP